uniref:Uncharacterized protein n=1 Tax=Aplanochytrium stocchinoi TaxID=215587 RepID=A0A7S3LI94_9STRA|mmetsp:Transcript_17400/g.20901  ORF Transcript_17400/g.20901 Transcript_17400/m.20901 type:complete len:150 (-) Transcript_17400:96-545(-)
MASLIRRFSSGASIGSNNNTHGKADKKKLRKRALSMPALDCSLQLDGNHMVLTNSGEWKLDRSTVGNFEREKTILNQRIIDLEEDKKYLIHQYKKTQEEKMMLEFRNKLLVEMLACSQLDCEKNNEIYQKEVLCSEALRWEVARLGVQY